MRAPYRWSKRPVANCVSLWRDFWHGLANVIRWTPVIWDDADFDWEFMARILEYKMRRMSCKFEKHPIVVGSERYARQTLICAELLKRLRDDEYFKRTPEWMQDRERVLHSVAVSKNDQRYLGQIIGKFMTHWWD